MCLASVLTKDQGKKVLTKDQAKNQFRLKTKEEELLTIWFGGIIDMYFCLSPYFKFPTNCTLFRTWCKMWKIIVRDSFWSNLIIVDALSETEMRWIWTRVGHAYVALSDPGVIWGQKYHLCLFAWKLKFGDWNHQRCFPWWQKMQKSVEKWPKKTFLHFLALWPRMIWSIFTP